MAKRAGKAANRRARQRKSQRPAPPSAPASVESVAVYPGQEAAEADVAVSHAPAPKPSPKARPSSQRASAAGGGSQLTAGERSEYHYVERDLRDIGRLAIIMTALLVVSWVAFRALGVLG